MCAPSKRGTVDFFRSLCKPEQRLLCCPQPLQHILAEAPAQRELGAIAQQNGVIAIQRRPQGLDAVHIHQCGTVHAQELSLSQPRFQRGDGFAQNVGVGCPTWRQT